MENTPFRPTIDSQASLEAAWLRLMQPLGFRTHSVWLMLIDPDGCAVPQMIEITDTADPPGTEDCEALVTFLRRLTDEVMPDGARVAFLVTRPGPAVTSSYDRAWATVLYGASREAGLPCETVHFAGDDAVRPLPMDELDLPATA